MECNICIEIKKEDNLFKCFSCKYINCIDCHKKYLLSSTLEPHCINCKSIIQYDNFLKKFNKKWVFGAYKEYKYAVLLDHEKSLFPQTVNYIHLKKIESKINRKKALLYHQIFEIKKEILNLDLEIQNLNISNTTNKIKHEYTYSCPIDSCKGYLNKDFICDLCDSTICKKCYIKLENNMKEHVCNTELVETFNTIKKEAKPCPTCGEFISKISGCDQMFCIKCGTAFSWNTGLIENGLIHNPHAHTFFENNANALENYLDNLNNNNNCRTPIPSFTFFEQKYFTEDNFILIKDIHRSISEYRQYERNYQLNFIQNNTDKNHDIRLKYISNTITEQAFKKTLFTRYKKNNYSIYIYQTTISAYDIGEILLWNIVDCISNNKKKIDIINNIEKIIELFHILIIDTNNNFNNISRDFLYKSSYRFNEKFKWGSK